MDLARLAWMSRRRRRRHERRQKHGRALGALRSALVGLVSIFLLCVVSFFALFGSRRSTARISPWTSGPSTCRKLQKTYSSSNSTPQARTSSCRSRRTAAPPGSPSRQGRRRVRPRKPQPPESRPPGNAGSRGSPNNPNDHRRPRTSRNNRHRSTGRPRSTANQSPTTIQPTGSRSRSGLPVINPWL